MTIGNITMKNKTEIKFWSIKGHETERVYGFQTLIEDYLDDNKILEFPHKITIVGYKPMEVSYHWSPLEQILEHLDEKFGMDEEWEQPKWEEMKVAENVFVDFIVENYEAQQHESVPGCELDVMIPDPDNPIGWSNIQAWYDEYMKFLEQFVKYHSSK